MAGGCGRNVKPGTAPSVAQKLAPAQGVAQERPPGASGTDWKAILRDGTVFSRAHLEKMQKGCKALMAFGWQADAISLTPAGKGRGVGVSAKELKRLYADPTNITDLTAKSDQQFKVYHYGAVGILLDPKTEEIHGLFVPAEKADELLEALKSAL